MTGFATHTVQVPHNNQSITLNISIKSLNSRFFECVFRLPSILQHLETGLIKTCKNQLIRGSISVNVQFDTSTYTHASLKLNQNVLTSYFEAAHQLVTHHGCSYEKPSANILLSFPGMLEPADLSMDEQTNAMIIAAFDQTIKKLVQERLREGTDLEKDLREQFILLKQLSDDIKIKIDALSTERKTKLQDALIPKDPSIDRTVIDSIYQIIQQQLDRIDIHEELVRFGLHQKQLEDILSSRVPEKGKKIDFTLQELLREISTIGSKSSDAAISSVVIDVKTILDKIREQAHNIV